MTKQTQVKILGQTQVKRYEVGWRSEDYFETDTVTDYPLIWEGMLDYPPFEEGQYIYIDEIESEVRINRIVRSNYNKYVYYTSHRVGELLDDDETQKSLEKAKLKIESNKAERIKREQETLLEEQEKQKSKFRKILDIIKS